MLFNLDPDVAAALAPMGEAMAATAPPYVTRLSRAGVEVEFHLRPGVPTSPTPSPRTPAWLTAPIASEH